MDFSSAVNSQADNIFPSLEQFKEQCAQGHKVVPVYHEILLDNEVPITALMKLGLTKQSFVLESVEGNEQIARYSFVGNDPYLIFRANGNNVTVGRAEKNGDFPNQQFVWEQQQTGNPIEQLQLLLDEYKAGPCNGLPRFFGGAVGYMGFDSIGYFEPVLRKAEHQKEIDDINMVFTRSLLIFDHLKGTLKVVVNVMPGADPVGAYQQAHRLIQSILGRLKRNLSLPRLDAGLPHSGPKIRHNSTKDEYTNAVVAAKNYINNGDAFQVVLSQQFDVAADFDPLKLFRCLKVVNPSPYMFYFRCDETTLVGASPEMLARMDGEQAFVRPIAGTRPRGSNNQEDERLSKQLSSDEKEQAEHLMLVDLGRNDLGRVCTFGSVEVEEFAQVEYFSHVMHLVSRVKGKILPGVKPLMVLAAAFPAGTVSGAPKIRAVEIINELEAAPRGAYAGLVGYIGYNGGMDTCINIRSVTIHDGIARIQSGGGIVADSQPEQEYQETINKARAMLQAVAMAGGGGQ